MKRIIIILMMLMMCSAVYGSVSEDGLVLYLNFDEGAGTVYIDHSPYENNVTNVGASTFNSSETRGDSNFSLDCGASGRGDSVSNIGLSGTDNRSYIGWVYQKGSGSDRRYWGWGTFSLFNYEYLAYKFSQTKIFAWHYGGDVGYNSMVQNTWVHVAYTYNGSLGMLYINGTNVANGSIISTVSDDQFSICGDPSNGNPANALIDELGVYNRTLNASEILDNYNSHAGSTFPSPPPPPDTSTMDLLFSNMTGDYKTIFDEGEDFYTQLNYTDDIDGSAINQSVATCNISIFDGLIEVDFEDDNFTLCDSGCNFSELTIQFNSSSTNAVNDSIHFNGCHEQTIAGDMQINFSCSTVSEVINIPANQMPLCDSDDVFIIIESDVCIASDDINITIDTADNTPFAQRKRLLNTAFDREFSLDLNQNGTALNFNGTSQLWEIDHIHEYYKHGIKRIDANCSHLAVPNLDNDLSENITIVNIFPQIIFDTVETSLGIDNLTDGVVIEYGSGQDWNFIISIVDDDLDTINVSFYNSSSLILSFNQSDNITINSSFFRDFESNPFSINVTANDTFGNISSDSMTFIVNDSINPSCDFASSYNDTFINSTISFNVSCTDESVFSLNVSCPANLYENVTVGLNTQSYNFNGSFLLTASDECSYEICDGHTERELKRAWDVDINNKSYDFSVDNRYNNILTVDDEGINIDYTVLKDRIIFEFDIPEDKTKSEYTLYYQSSNQSYYSESDKWEGWIKDYPSRTWFDLTGMGKVKVTYINDGLWRLDVKTDETHLKFESIGELNCISGNFSINARPLPDNQAISDYKLDNTTNVLLLFVLVFLYLGLMAIGLAFNNKGFVVIGFGVGVVIGFMLYNLGGGLMLMMVLGNILISVLAVTRK